MKARPPSPGSGTVAPVLRASKVTSTLLYSRISHATFLAMGTLVFLCPSRVSIITELGGEMLGEIRPVL